MQRREFLAFSLGTGLLGGLGRLRDSLRVADLALEQLVAFGRYQAYITPEAPIVQRYASGTVVTDTEIVLPEDPDVEYVPDTAFGLVDYWQTPTEYYRNSFRGDCEDYAFFFCSVLEAMGYDTRLVMGTLEGDVHALAEFRDDGYVVTGVTDPKAVVPRETLVERNRWRPRVMFGSSTAVTPYHQQW